MQSQDQNIKLKVEELRNTLSDSKNIKTTTPVSRNLMEGKLDKTLRLSSDGFNDKGA